ncbi:MAG: hypothetical protein QOF85_2831 [Solirubrobacterales bacterium]|nr:hypothetical protein [Solirubrobacterales bacterium]
MIETKQNKKKRTRHRTPQIGVSFAIVRSKIAPVRDFGLEDHWHALTRNNKSNGRI